MAKLNQVDFKLYGLQHEKNGAVRADIFAKKLMQFVDGLKAADRHINGKKSLNYLIADLEYGSAVARITEERISTNVTPRNSSIGYFQDKLADIRDGKKIESDTPEKVLKTIARLGNGSSNNFSHGEVEFVGDADNVIRIDNFFNRRADKVLDAVINKDEESFAFAGMAYLEFSGIIKEIDLRGKIASAKLFLTAGNSEIDCICNSVSVDNLSDALDQKVIVNAKAFYDGENKLPERLDIKKIRKLKVDADLVRWADTFHFQPDELGRAI